MKGALLVAVALLGLSSCSPQQCDPSQAGFLSGLGCEASGSFATRNRDQQSLLAQQNAALLRNQAQQQAEGARANQALLSRDETRERLGALDRQTSLLESRLAAARARGGMDQARLGRAQAELDALKRQRASLPAAASEQQVRAYEEQHRRFMDDLEAI